MFDSLQSVIAIASGKIGQLTRLVDYPYLQLHADGIYRSIKDLIKSQNYFTWNTDD